MKYYYTIIIISIISILLVGCVSPHNEHISLEQLEPISQQKITVELTSQEIDVVTSCIIEENIELASYLRFMKNTTEDCRETLVHIKPITPEICDNTEQYASFIEYLEETYGEVYTCEYHCDEDNIEIADISIPDTNMIILSYTISQYHTNTIDTSLLHRRKFFTDMGYSVSIMSNYDIEILLDSNEGGKRE